MNFSEWTEKRKETAPAVSFLPEQRTSFSEWTQQRKQLSAPAADTGGSFGSLRGTVSRPNAGRGGGLASTPTTVTDYAGEMSRLQETRRQAAVDMDMDGVNAADDAMKALRASAGKQTFGDRLGDVIGAASAGTVGSIANTLSTLWELAGGDADYRIADIAAEDSQRFTQSAKAGLGKAGQFAVDTGISGLHLLGDAAANTLLPGAGLALSGARSFGGGAQEAREGGADLKEQTAYGLGSAATSMLTEKLGNTSGLLKSAYGSGWLDDASLGTLGKLALSAVSEGGEEFVEGAAPPLLKNLTYDRDAAYDDDWLSDTLRDTAVGTALGGLGGAVDVVSNRLKADTDTLAKQENPVPKPETGNTRLTDTDMSVYLQVGDRQHVRNAKDALLSSGDSPILSTPEKVKSFIRNSIVGRTRNTIKAYGRVGKRFQSDVSEKSEGRMDISGYYLELDSNRLQHLADHIRDDGDPRNIPLTEEQVASIPDYIDTYDDVLDVVTRKDGQTRIYLGKQINGHSVIVVLSSKGRKSVQPVTAWQNTTEHYLKKYGKTQIDTSQ